MKISRLLALLVPLLASFVAEAALPPINFTTSVSSANGSITPTLTWDNPTASSCMASGSPLWVGTRTVSGSMTLPPITVHGTYQLTLTCTWAGDDKAKLTWTAPTQNTDGSTLTNLAGYRLYYGTSVASLTQTVSIPGAGVTTYTVTGLTPGTYFFAITAQNDQNVESALSTAVSKAITGSASQSQSITLTVNPVPAAATNLQVQ